MPRLVLLAEQLFAPVPGGTGRYTRELALALTATAPAHWSLTTAVARRRDPTAAVIPGVDGPHMLPLPRHALVQAWDRGLALWPGGDAVHAPTPLAPPRARRGRSLVVTVHDTVPWSHPDTLTPRGVRWHQRAITRAARNAGALVVPTRAVSAELTTHTQPACRVHVIGEGVTPSVVTSARADVEAAMAQRLKLPPRYLLTVGTLEPRKGLDVLLAAMGRPNTPQLPLVVVGQQGWGAVDPMRLADQSGVDRSRVLLLGRIPDAELAVVLRRAAALVAPSHAEGFGLPVLEAMAAGVPVVHSDAPALIEVAGGTGVAFRRCDAGALASGLRTVFDDPQRTAALVRAARTRAQLFSWERAARQIWRVHLELYQSTQG